MDPTKAKANYSRVCQLLVNKGSVALRNVLNVKHPRSTLATGLNANKLALTKLRYRVINDSQWDLLFPTSGAPDSNNFDITLMTILLRNICGLSPPTTGWNALPSVADISTSADIVRIKRFRNDVYGHLPSAQFDDTKFHALWQDISQPLIRLGICQNDIDELKNSPLSPEEEIYIEELKKWKELDDDILSKMRDLEDTVKEEVRNVKEKLDSVEEKVGCVEEKVDSVNNKVVELKNVVEISTASEIDKLAMFDFAGKIDSLCKKFLAGTREWLLEKISRSFCDRETQLIIFTASPGFGKSVLLAKVCEMYKQKGQLAASHFCVFRNSDYCDPHKILQSLACQMCKNVDGFREKLSEVLRREHSRHSLSDAFRVLINDPLHALPGNREMLIVVDALDESKIDVKSEFLEIILENFTELPEWIKILISGRPEWQVRKNIPTNYILEIPPDNCRHRLDLQHFIQNNLPTLTSAKILLLLEECQGSFLYAYFLVRKSFGEGIDPNATKGISGFYDKQFKRLRTGLKRLRPDTWGSTLKSFVNVVAAFGERLPIKILFTCMELSDEECEIREKFLDIMAEILPIYDSCLTVYHKSLLDWLTLDEYEEHAFVADVAVGNKRLWRACRQIYNDIESLKSASDVQITPVVMYALKYGSKFLLTDVDDVEDLRWLISTRINYLKIKFFSYELITTLDVPRIVQLCRSQVADVANRIYWGIIQLNSFSDQISAFQFPRFLKKHEGASYLSAYLQFTAMKYSDDASTGSTICMPEAKDILNNTDDMWVEKIETRKNSKSKIVSHATLKNEMHSPKIFHNAMELSPDKKLFAYSVSRNYVEVLKMPSLEIFFNVKVDSAGLICSFVKFSPDSTFFLFNSVRSCVSVMEQKEVPFLTDGPEECLYCSFSSCGMKLVTSEPEQNCIKVWDVRKKVLLVQSEIKFDVDECFFSFCGSYILARPRDDTLMFSIYEYFQDFIVFRSITMERVDKKVRKCCNPCLTQGNCYQIITPDPCDSDQITNSFKISHLHLPTGEVVVIANRYCTKSIYWKERSNCLAYYNCFEGSSQIIVSDYINQEIVEFFHVNLLICGTSINFTSHIDQTHFLVGLDPWELFLLRFETANECSSIKLFERPALKCCVLSPQTSHLACCYENCFVTIESIDSRKILQIVPLKREPEACWWSQSYLWIVCKGVVVKFPCDWTKTKVLGSENEECVIVFEKVLKCDKGVLVVSENGKISIFKLVNENLCRQEIADSYSNVSAVSVSPDGCAVLLYCKPSSDYQLWEIATEHKWELFLSGKVEHQGEVVWFCLTGKKGYRSSFWLMLSSSHYIIAMLSNGSLSLYSFDFTKGKSLVWETFNSGLLSITNKSVVYVDSDILVIHHDRVWLYYIDISNGGLITKFFLGNLYWSIPAAKLYIPARGLLLFVSKNNVKYFRIHNIKYLTRKKPEIVVSNNIVVTMYQNDD